MGYIHRNLVCFGLRHVDFFMIFFSCYVGNHFFQVFHLPLIFLDCASLLQSSKNLVLSGCEHLFFLMFSTVTSLFRKSRCSTFVSMGEEEQLFQKSP